MIKFIVKKGVVCIMQTRLNRAIHLYKKGILTLQVI